MSLLGLELRDAIGIDGRALERGQRLNRDAPDLRPTLARAKIAIELVGVETVQQAIDKALRS